MKKWMLSLLFCLAVAFCVMPAEVNATTKDSQTGLYYDILEDGTVNVSGYLGSNAEVVIPAEIAGKPVTTIGDDYPYWSKTITRIVLPESVTRIGKNAFDRCTGLQEIDLPAGITEIGDYAFNECSSLAYIVIPDSVRSIGARAFQKCTALKEIQLPSSLQTLGESVFSSCDALAKLELPDAVTSIGKRAFSGCTSLTKLELPDTITSIGEYAFYNCTALTEVNIPNSLTVLPKHLFTGCSAITKLIIPDSVTTIEERALDCENLKWLTMGKGVTTIARTDLNGAFAYQAKLDVLEIADVTSWLKLSAENKNKSIVHAQKLYLNGEPVTHLVIPEGVEEVPAYAFSGIGDFTAVTLPATVKSVANYALGVTEIHISDLTAYANMKKVALWNSLYPEKNKLYLNGELLTDLVIPENLTEIPEAAFCDLNLESITIGSHVRKIGAFAFRDNATLKTLTIAEGVTEIGSQAFHGCKALRHVRIPDSVVTIGDEAFKNCNSLLTLALGKGLTNLGKDVFYQPAAFRHVLYSGTKEQWIANAFTANGNHIADGGHNTVHFEAKGDEITLLDGACCRGPIIFHCSICNGRYADQIAAALDPSLKGDHEYTEKSPTVCVWCGEANPNAHVHDWQSALVDEATCTICGEKHTHQWTGGTCTTAGACAICKMTDPRPVGHQWSEPGTSGVKICTVCGVVEDHNHAWVADPSDGQLICSVCGQRHTHNWTEATCKVPKTCADCGATEGTVAAHQPEEKWNYDATYHWKLCVVCGADIWEYRSGHETGNCTCGYHSHTWATGTGGWRYCTICEEGHYCVWTGFTCGAAGWCQICGQKQPEAPGHQWTAPNAEGTRTCTVCGRTETEHEHIWAPGPVKDQVYCTVCGSAHDHQWSAPDSNGIKTCNVCGTTQAPCAHVWVPGANENEVVCSLCGEHHHHEWIKATCTTLETCAGCGATRGNAGHNWQATTTEQATCLTCGEVHNHQWSFPNTDGTLSCLICNATKIPHEHIWGPGANENEAICSICGEVHPHNWHPANCTKPQTCAGCGATLGEPVHKLVHTAMVEPTCTAEGKTEGEHCADCGLVTIEAKPIPVRDHNWKFKEVIDGVYIEQCEYCNEIKKTIILVVKLPDHLDLAPVIMTQEEWERIEKGESHDISLQTTDITKNLTPEQEAEYLQALLGVAVGEKFSKFSIGMYLDIDLCKRVGEDPVTIVDKTDKPVEVEIQIPVNLQTQEAGVTRNFHMIRILDGKGEVMESRYDAASKTLTFETNAFGTFVLVYSDEKTEITYGDANGDGKVNAKDAMLVLQYYTKKITEDKLDGKAVDVDGNGKINAKDAMLILQLYTKKITQFPVEAV